MKSEIREQIETMESITARREEYDKQLEKDLLLFIDSARFALERNRIADRSPKDRIYAMCITHLQEAGALFDRYVVRAE